MQPIISSTKTEHFSCSQELLSIWIFANPEADVSLFLIQIKKKGLIQPNVKHRNVDFIVSFGLLDEQIQLTLPKLLGVVVPRICLVFHALVVFSSTCRWSREQASLANSVNHIFCADLTGTVYHHTCAVLCLCPTLHLCRQRGSDVNNLKAGRVDSHGSGPWIVLCWIWKMNVIPQCHQWRSATLCPEHSPKLVSGFLCGETSISCRTRGVAFSVAAICSFTTHTYLCFLISLIWNNITGVFVANDSIERTNKLAVIFFFPAFDLTAPGQCVLVLQWLSFYFEQVHWACESTIECQRSDAKWLIEPFCW